MEAAADARKRPTAPRLPKTKTTRFTLRVV